MNKIFFKNITVQNFKSIGPEIFFDFEKHFGLNYIYGTNLDIVGTANGVGKSTIFVDAVLFALFGKTLKNTNNSYIPNRSFSESNNVETVVKLNFIVNSKNFTSIATIKKIGYPVSFRLFEDGIEITKSTAPKTRDYLKTEILKCSFGLFVNSIILSSSNSYNFFEMNKGQRREYIENIFKITCFGDMLKLIRIDINQLARQILIEQQEKRLLVDNLETYRSNFDTFKNDKFLKVQDIKTKISFKQELMDEIIINEVDLEPIEESLKEEQSILMKISEAGVKISAVVGTSLVSIEHIKKTIIKNNEIIDLVCGDCKQKLDDGYTKELKNKIIELQTLIDEKNSKRKEIDDAYKTVNENIKVLKKELKDATKRKVIAAQQKLDLIHFGNAIEQLNEDIETVNKEKNPFKKMIQDTDGSLTNITEILDKHYSEKTELDILEHVVSDDGAKKFMVKDLVKVLNTLIRQYLNEMGADFTVHFNESFDSVFLTNTGECDYTSFSAGERQRINVATLFAFRDILNNTGIESNVFVLDEVIDQGIDEYALKAVLGILKRIVEQKNQTIFIVSHRPETSENMDFDNIIEITKKNSISKINQDAQGEE